MLYIMPVVCSTIKHVIINEAPSTGKKGSLYKGTVKTLIGTTGASVDATKLSKVKFIRIFRILFFQI